MGATYVDVTVRNQADPHRSLTGKFLVDTGAFDSLVPRGRREYVLADGKPTTLEMTMAERDSHERP